MILFSGHLATCAAGELACEMYGYWTTRPDSPYVLQPGQMKRVVDEPRYTEQRNGKIRAYFERGAPTQCPDTCRVNLDTGWQVGEFGTGDIDLNFAFKGFSYRQSGTLTLALTRLPDGRYRLTGQTRVDFDKSWNFDYGDSVHGFPLDLFAELHRKGYAKDFKVQGSSKENVDITVG
ncbi:MULTISPECIES: hypothetical protein [unclassified Streptomyces]|uniref:hypothetical protein n=1 Tax=unclassified Streptomyces TaxID=2593676 RepID=UPI003702E637